MRTRYLLITLFAIGGLGLGQYVSAQSFTLSSNIPTSPLAVGLNPLPDTLAVAPDTLFPVATPTGGLSPYTYVWGPAGSNYQFPGGQNEPQLILAAGDPLTIFSVTVSDANGCSSVATFSIDPTTDAASELEESVTLEVYPNPNNGSFHVSLEGEPFSASFDLLVKDQVGRSVYIEHLPKFTGSFQRDINLNGLSSGIYFLGLGSGEKIVYRKLIIE